MSAVTKALPKNIKELTSQPAAKTIDDKYTVEILQEKLKAGGVRYLSADTKSVLVWRFMDMESMDFDAKLGDIKSNDPQDDKENTDDGFNIVQSVTDVSVDSSDGSVNNAHIGANTTTQPPIEPTIEPVSKYGVVVVEHTGAFNFYEPATGTLVLARKTTEITATYQASVDRITKNIEQYNSTRGQFLKIK